MNRLVKRAITCSVAVIIMCYAISCAERETISDKLHDEAEVTNDPDVKLMDTLTFNPRSATRIDSVTKVMRPKHPVLRWTSIKELLTKGIIYDDENQIVLIQYFKNGELNIDDSEFKRGRYTIIISDTIGNILSEQFISR